MSIGEIDNYLREKMQAEAVERTAIGLRETQKPSGTLIELFTEAQEGAPASDYERGYDAGLAEAKNIVRKYEAQRGEIPLLSDEKLLSVISHAWNTAKIAGRPERDEVLKKLRPYLRKRADCDHRYWRQLEQNTDRCEFCGDTKPATPKREAKHAYRTADSFALTEEGEAVIYKGMRYLPEREIVAPSRAGMTAMMQKLVNNGLIEHPAFDKSEETEGE